MPSIGIHIDEGASLFRLTGDVDELWRNRRARFYLNDHLLAEYGKEQCIEVPFAIDKQGDRERVMLNIQSMLEKFGFDELLSGRSKEVLNDLIEEKERFGLFSQKAKMIWNNAIGNVELEEFRHFTDVLNKQLPRRTLYHLQLLAAYHLTFSQNACNFSVPGAGKTSVVYAAYTYLKSLPQDDPKHVNRLFIVGPLSSFGPWEDEYEACFGTRPDAKRLSGGVSKNERLRQLVSPNGAEITLISYQGVVSELDDIIAYLRRPEHKVMVVLDEAHKVKNTDGGIWAQSILAIARYCKSRVVLTGTPTPNGYEDIYNLYNFIWPDRNIIPFHLHQLKEMSQNEYDDRIEELVESLAPFFIRITKEDLKRYMQLPDATEHPPIVVPMEPVHRQIYEYLEDHYIGHFEDSLVADHNQVGNLLLKARLIRLMQAATNPTLLQKPIMEFLDKEGVSNELFIDDTGVIDQIMQYRKRETPAKFLMVEQMVEKILAKGGKIIVWGVYIYTMVDLQAYLQQKGIAAKLLIGQTPVEKDELPEGVETREAIVREFNDPASTLKVIIANPFAVAESISLHKACRHAIYLERNFNAATFLQSKDRIHRVGLKEQDEVNYYYLLSENTVDVTIHERLLQKERRMLQIIEGKRIPLIDMNLDLDVDSLSKLDREDLKAMILDYVKRAAKDQ